VGGVRRVVCGWDQSGGGEEGLGVVVWGGGEERKEEGVERRVRGGEGDNGGGEGGEGGGSI